MGFFRAATFTLLLGISPVQLLGQTCDLYVNASDGDESNSGADPAQALRSMESAFDASVSGGSVCVSAGEYFFGADADGIVLAGQDKSVRFVLNSFAGRSEVLISERSLTVDVGSGTVGFEAGSASLLRLGAGVFNSDAVTGPANLNFAHTLDLRSGSLDVSGITFTNGPSVGNPEYVNPVNASKQAPSSSAVLIGDAVLIGQPVFESASARVVAFTTSSPSALSLPSGLGASNLSFRNSAELTVSIGDLLEGVALSFESPSSVTLVGQVRLNSPEAIRSSGSGSVAFTDGLAVDGAVPDTLLRHTGTGTIGLGAVGTASPTVVLNAGGGGLSVTEASGALDVHNRAGLLTIGSQQFAMALEGTLTNEDNLMLAGSTTLTGTLINSGQLDLSGNTVTLLGATIEGSGLISGGSVITSGTVSLRAGELPDLHIADGATSLEATSVGALSVDGEIALIGSGTLDVLSLYVGSNGTVRSGTLTGVRVHGILEQLGVLDLGSARLELRDSATFVGESTSARVALIGDGLSLSAASPLPPLELTGNSLLLEGPIVAQSLDLMSGTATTSVLTLIQGLSLSPDSRLTFEGEARLEIGSNLVSDGLVEGRPAVILTGSGLHTVQSSPPLRLGNVTLAQAGATMAVAGPLQVDGSLDLAARAVQLSAGAVLTLGGDLDLSANSLSGPGSLRLEGLAIQTISGPATTVLPTLTIAGGGVRIPAGGRVMGDVRVLGGASTVSGVFSVDGDLEWSGGTLSMIGADLHITGPARQVSLRGTLRVTDFAVLGAQTTATLSGALQVGEELWVDSGALLSLGTSNVTLTGSAGSGRVLVDGSYEDAPGGGVQLTGGANYVLDGAGLFGSLKISLSSDGRNVSVGSGTSRLRISGDLNFDVGGLDIGNANLELVAQTRAPRFLRNVSDRSPANGVPDGGLPTSSSGDVEFDAPDGYGLVLDGSLANVYEVGPELLPEAVASIEVRAVDGINASPIFGVRLAHEGILPGPFLVSDGSVVFLSEPLRVQAEASVLSVLGRVTGRRLEILAASGISGGPETRVDSLRINTLLGAPVLDLAGVASIGTLEILAGEVEIAELSTPAATTVSERLNVGEGAALRVRQRLHTGDNSRLDIIGQLSIGSRSSVYLGSGTTVYAPGTSTILLGNPEEQTDVIGDGGFLVTTGLATLDIATELPRLMLAAAEAGSDDVLLESDLTVSDRLVVIDGDLLLGAHTLRFTGTSWDVDTDGAPLDGGSDGILGQLGGAGSTVVLSGSMSIGLGGPLDIQSATLVINGARSDTVHVGGSPANISVTGAGVHLDSGVLSLGTSDLVLSATIPEVLRLSGGRVVSSAGGSATSDSDWGEVVLGGGTSSLRLVEPTHIDAIRLRGSLTVETSGQSLTIGKRLVFGESGASLLTPIPGLIRLSEQSYLVRRGLGTLTHAPMPTGEMRLVYDLIGRPLPGGILQSSEELIRPPFRIAAVLVEGGATGSSQNTVRLTTDVDVDSIIVGSGVLDLSGRSVDLGSRGALFLHGTSETAAPDVTGGSGLRSEAAIALELVTPYHDSVLGSALWPAGLAVGSLLLSAGTETTPRSILLQASRGADQIVMDMGGTSSQLVLNGFSLEAQDGMELVRGIVGSGPAARLSARHLTIGSGGTVRAPVSTVSDDLTVDGRFAGLFAQASGDVIVNGDFGDGASLILDGTHQMLQFTGDETFNQLVLNQTEDTAGVTVAFESGSVLTLNGGITLGNGLLSMGNATLRLPGSVDGFTRTAGSLSHVIGRIERPIPAGFTGLVRFPTGSSDAFRPLDLIFETPLFSATNAAATHFDSTPIGMGGLQTQESAAPFRWLVTSSVNFGLAQPVGFSAGAEDLSGTGPVVAREGGALSTWIPWGGSSTVQQTDDGVLLTTPEASGGLSVSGLELTMAIGTPHTSTASLQLVNLAPEPDAPMFDVFLDSDPIRLGSDYLDATPRQPMAGLDGAFGLFSAIQPSRGFPPSGQPLAELEAPQTDNLLLALSPGRRMQAVVIQPGKLSLVHAAVGLDVLTVSMDGDVLGTTLAPGASLSGLDVSAGPLEVGFTDESGAGRGSFLIEVPQLSAEGGALLLSGYSALPSGLDGDRELALRLLTAEGALLEAVTLLDAQGDPALPASLRTLGAYPNPASWQTRVLFDLPRASLVRMEVYDVTGRRVYATVSSLRPAGSGQRFDLDSSGLAPGVYLYRISADSESATGRFVVLK